MAGRPVGILAGAGCGAQLGPLVGNLSLAGPKVGKIAVPKDGHSQVLRWAFLLGPTIWSLGLVRGRGGQPRAPAGPARSEVGKIAVPEDGHS